MNRRTFILSIAFAFLFAVATYAAYPTTPFSPSDQELDPSCAPGEVNCYVAIGLEIQSNTTPLTTAAKVINFGSGLTTTDDGNGVVTVLATISDWKLTGNSGTVPGTDFIGTTDAQDLVFKTNAQTRMRITSAGSLVLTTPVLSGADTAPSIIMGSTYGAGTMVASAPGSSIIGHSEGVMTASGWGSSISGVIGGSGSMTASGSGSNILGIAGSGGSMTASNGGASVIGYASYGSMTASAAGSMVQGLISTSGGGTMQATGNGSLVRGRAQNGGIGRAAGPGSMVSGIFSTFSGNASLMETSAGANGAHVFGGVENGSQMLGYGGGAMVLGFTGNHGTIRAGNTAFVTHGAIAMGYAWAIDGFITNEADGSLAGGYATNDTVYNSGIASLVWGRGVQNTGADYSIVLGRNVANTTARTFIVGWDRVQLKANDSGIAVGNSVNTGAVATFQNNTATCNINPTTASLSCASDYRLKKNIHTLNGDAFILDDDLSFDDSSTILDKIGRITPVVYNWNAETDGAEKHIGFIAQEIESVFPDLVSTDSITGFKSMNYTGLIPYTIQAVQEMGTTITDIVSLQEGDNSFVSMVRQWLGDAGNSISNLYARTIHTDRVNTKQLCVGDHAGAQTCITKDQLDALLGKYAQDELNTPPEPTQDPAEEPAEVPSVPADPAPTAGGTTLVEQPPVVPVEVPGIFSPQSENAQ